MKWLNVELMKRRVEHLQSTILDAEEVDQHIEEFFNHIGADDTAKKREATNYELGIESYNTDSSRAREQGKTVEQIRAEDAARREEYERAGGDAAVLLECLTSDELRAELDRREANGTGDPARALRRAAKRSEDAGRPQTAPTAAAVRGDR